jgi:ribosomal protein S18 acetylase RimI-like enzyme
MSLVIRKAQDTDKDFLINAIIETEKSGSEMISYCAIFSISESDLRKLLADILDEAVEGQELCISNFLIAEVDGEPAATISAWIEKESGVASSILKSNILMYFLGADVIRAAMPALTLMNEVSFNREEGALQIECVYTLEKYRGMGLAGSIIEEHIRISQEAGSDLEKVQVILLENNAAARRAYEKAGFRYVSARQCANNAILSILPCNTKILMENIIK